MQRLLKVMGISIAFVLPNSQFVYVELYKALLQPLLDKMDGVVVYVPC